MNIAKKTIIKISIPLGIALGALIAFTNTTNERAQETQKILRQLTSLEAKINRSTTSIKARKTFRALKQNALNRLTLNWRLSSCDTLKSIAPTATSGVYLLFNHSLFDAKPALVDCVFTQGQATKQAVIFTPEDIELRQLTMGTSENILRTVRMASTAGQTTRKAMRSIAGLPVLLNQVGSVRCNESAPGRGDANFGYDDQGIWVKNGCSGTFQVSRANAFAFNRAVAPQNSKAIKGYVDLFKKETDGEYYLYGWACELGLNKPIAVQVTVDSDAGRTVIASGWAKNNSEPAVGVACSTPGVGHRYKILIPKSMIAAHDGKALYVGGLSVKANGMDSASLANTGKFSLPGKVQLDCSSNSYKYNVCNVTNISSQAPLLVQRYSHSACTLNYSFGVNAQGLWVNHGCRGKFEVSTQ